MDNVDFVNGLEALPVSGVTMLTAPPETAPADGELPLAWVEDETLIGREPETMFMNNIRPMAYRAGIWMPVVHARKGELRQHRPALRAKASALKNALDAANFGFRLTYQIAVEKKITVGGETFYGIGAVVTGER